MGRPSAAKVELGRMLFFDKILSGNRNIACATCHHPEPVRWGRCRPAAFGEGRDRASAPDRAGRAPRKAESVHGRVPRNSPALFNLGAREFTRMFHDGRVEVDDRGATTRAASSARPSGSCPTGLDNVLAAQAMFPVISAREMAGQKGENPVADARVAEPCGRTGRRLGLARRAPAGDSGVRGAFPAGLPRAGHRSRRHHYVQAANAIAAFEAQAFRGDGSPFDEYLRGLA